METFAENIRLVIWDLDETFWQGTLEEGDVIVPERNIGVVTTLAKRGIISSLCSKNDFDAVRARLERDDLWKWFVFPAIAFAPKSNLIGPMIEQIGLRPETVLFVDDNELNRAEVLDQVPGINVAAPEIIASLLDHPQLRGKDDSSLSRLGQYKILETRQSVIANSASPDEFLRGCDIVISFHTDIERQFERIHELVNRTNQLNFTKQRWDEDAEVARKNYFDVVKKDHTRHACYVKVRDKFGYYGICGFYETVQPGRAIHFAFSCRILNMGVEQFVYQKLRFPWVNVIKPCAGQLQKKNLVDWIRVVDDAELGAAPAKEPLSRARICLRGPCEIIQSVHYLRPYYETIEEFQYPKSGWGIYRSLLRYTILADELAERGITCLEQLGLPADFGGFDFAALPSAFLAGDAEIGIFSFSMESEISLYRHRSTGLLIPLGTDMFNSADMTQLAIDDIARARQGKVPIEAPHFEAFQREFEYYRLFDLDIFRADLVKLKARLQRIARPVIVVEPFDDTARRDCLKYRANRKTNRIVREYLAPFAPLVRFVRFAHCVENMDEEIEVNHFHRRAYIRLAGLLRQTIGEASNLSTGQPQFAKHPDVETVT